jgi:hypothetical protein
VSLLLRKKCQELLDNVGLENYHVQVNSSNKYLEIAGECGQVLVTIEGIRLSRMSPSVPEIDLALELFDAFLARHTPTFHEFLQAKAVADKVSTPETPPLQNVKVEKAAYRDYTEMEFYMVQCPGSPCFVKSSGEVVFPARTVNIYKEPDHTLCLALTTKENILVRKWVDGFRLHTEAVKARDRALAKLSSCEI